MLTRILENNVRLGFDIPETKFGEMDKREIKIDSLLGIIIWQPTG